MLLSQLVLRFGGVGGWETAGFVCSAVGSGDVGGGEVRVGVGGSEGR